jgi:pimeloyl-ACP methyl ester carboxylesterase
MKVPPVVIVPDLGDGARSWQQVANLITGFAADVVAVEPAGDSLEADAARVRAALDAASEPPVVIAHGYGALAASLAANRRNVRQLIFVAGYMLDYGETIFEVVGGPATALSTTPVEHVAWRAVPTTYIMLKAARRIAPVVQERLAQTHATTIVTLDAGDHPYRTHAAVLAQVLYEDLLSVSGAPLHEIRELLLRSA